MIKFPVKNRFNGATQFTAEIDCAEGEKTSIKLGLAVKWAVENGADLRVADLRRADLRGADLRNTNLRNADLSGADLSGADLSNVNLRDADLSNVNLMNADLRGANLMYADLWAANLGYANLRNADLSGADLKSAHGVNEYVKCMHLEEWTITYTAEVMQIGCERHDIEEWRGFGDKRILEMDGKRALVFWRKWKDTIFQIIEMCPAKPTNGSKEKKANAEKQRLRLENGKGTEQ